MNLREFDTWISKKEGGKRNLPIAQISEVRKWVLVGLGKHFKSGEILKLAYKYNKKYGK